MDHLGTSKVPNASCLGRHYGRNLPHSSGFRVAKWLFSAPFGYCVTRCGEMARAIFDRSQAIGPLEVSRELAFVPDPRLEHDLLDTEKSRLDQFFCKLHPQGVAIMYERFAGFCFKKMPQTRGRKIHVS